MSRLRKEFELLLESRGVDPKVVQLFFELEKEKGMIDGIIWCAERCTSITARAREVGDIDTAETVCALGEKFVKVAKKRIDDLEARGRAELELLKKGRAGECN